jgi:hypothetical protein
MKAGRLAVLTLVFIALGAATSEIAARGDPAQASSCNATLVRYEWNKDAGGSPWITVGPTRARLEGWLYSYHAYVADERVNQSERVVVRAGVEEKIVWFSRKWGGRWLTLSGRRIDGTGSFSQRFRAAYGSGAYPSGLKIPETGCWRLTLRTEGWARQIVVEAIEPPAKGTCDATPVPESAFVVVTPRRSGIVAGWGPWLTPEGGALLYVGGRTPEGGNTKVLWKTTRDASFYSGDLTLRGAQLDGPGTFRQTFREVSPAGHWPSIPVMPSSGCWLLTVRISGQPGAAGIIVVRAV